MKHQMTQAIFKAQIDSEQVRMDKAFERVQPAIDEQLDLSLLTNNVAQMKK